MRQNVSNPDGPANNAASPSAPEDSEPAVSQRQAGSTSTTTYSVLPKMSDPNPATFDQGAATSQPMAKSNSSGSNPSNKEAKTDTASPYGTRSRGRNGRERPNYAEDKDIDMELFEMYPERRNDGDDARKPTRQSNTSINGVQDAAPRSTTTSTRKPLPSDGRQSREQQSSAPAVTNSATTTVTQQQPTQPSKKRKAAAQSTPGGGASHNSATASLTVASRRQATSSQASSRGYGETNMLTFDDCRGRLKDGLMVADDGTALKVNDHVYLVCEPPGEPYYLGRIMEFLHAKNDHALAVDALRVNWYYRPKDIARKVQDTRSVFATMYSDISPLTALRGKCQIKHKAEIENMDEYRKTRDSFWFEKLYDRYIQKNYDVIPTFQIVNVPEAVKKVLDERWKYILVEQGRGKELTSAVKSCKRCTGYCASNDSVDCAVCKNTYHMNCVKPPLLKKPSRGFAWSCAQCSRAQERKLEARNTPNVHDPNHEAEEEEYVEEEEEDVAAPDTGRTSPADGPENGHSAATAEQIYHASLWPYRYLGINCKVEDALDYDDRIYPRAATRVGPRHQATVLPWPGRPVQYVKPLEIKKNGRRDAKLSKEAQAALEADRIAREKRPKWVQDQPAGYVARGEDLDDDDPNNTAQLLYKPPESSDGKTVSESLPDEYMDQAMKLAKSLGLPERSTNLQDVASSTLMRNDFDADKALIDLKTLDQGVFREPQLNQVEQKKFEEAIGKYGSELHSVMKHVKTLFYGDIVRYYYTWKKTDRGKQIWGNHSGRKGKKEAKEAKKLEAAAAHKLQDDVADDHDDSAFDAEKARDKKRQFMCKFCNTTESRQWRRAPNATSSLVTENGGKNPNKDKSNQYLVALCRRCAELWRRYAVQWEDMDALAQKVASAGGRAWKKKIDEELLKELAAADDMMRQTVYNTSDQAGSASSLLLPGHEPPRKRLKGLPDKESEPNASDSGMSGIVHTKKKEKPLPPAVPEIPKPRTMPCAICHQLEPLGDQHLSCRECRLAVHRNCYGVIDNRNPGKWVCDMCANDKSPQISIQYRCVLCPVDYTEHDFVEPPKISHKKKTEKERERERTEREAAQKAADWYKKRQEDMNRPVNPREPLKRTADNNWVHVTCAVWTPEVKFGNARALEPSEGIPSIPRVRYGDTCKLCRQAEGACIACHQCRAPVHVECAHQAGYLLGFDITPVKGSRRDHTNIVTINGESGAMTAGVWCKDHIPQKTIVHRMHDPVDEQGMNALQLYVQNFKQADLALTGCARKANLITLAAKMSSTTPPQPVNRRASLVAQSALGSSPPQVNGDHRDKTPEALQPGGKICLTCGVDVSPKWYPIDETQERELMNGYYGKLGTEAQKFVAQRNFQCHQCKKSGKQPKPHAVVKEPSPEPTPLRTIPPSAPPVVTPPPAAEVRPVSRPSSYAWAPPTVAPVSHQQPAPIQLAAPPPAVQAVPIQAPPVAPPPLPPQTIVPRAAPPPASPYQPPSNPSYNDWHRPPPMHHSPPVHHQAPNGVPPPHVVPPSMPPLAPPNHLRPPPLATINHPPPPPPPAPMQNGHMGQSMVNGMPPSPMRSHGPPLPMGNGNPYGHPYHHPVHHPPQHLTNGGPPLRAPDHPFSQVLHHPQRSPFSTPHGSPPTPRDSLSMGRDHHPSSNAPPRPNENRPPSGASASPSLRNLLS